MTFSSYTQFKKFVIADATRYLGPSAAGVGKILKIAKLYFCSIGFHYTYWMRLSCYLSTRKYLFPIYLLGRLRLTHISHNSGIQIDPKTQIDKGFYIGHFGTIVINGRSILGKNINISPGVNIGQANRGEHKGTAVIGDNVYIGPGAKIVGAVHIGNNVCIGANAVVTHDVPDNACVAGVPAQIISMKGTEGYVDNKV